MLLERELSAALVPAAYGEPSLEIFLQTLEFRALKEVGKAEKRYSTR
jgi:hypothetical protein